MTDPTPISTPPIRIISFADALASLGDPSIPDWYELTDEQRSKLDYNLWCCMHYHIAPFTLADIAIVETIVEDYTKDSMGEGTFEWNVLLKDGRRYHVDADHDYTGWDCQSSADYELVQ